MRLPLTFIALAGIIYLAVFSSCTSLPEANNIRGVHLLYKIPVFTSDSNYELKNAYDVFYDGDLVLYRTSYNFDSSFNGKSVMREERNSFFVFHKDSLFGRVYNAFGDPAGNSPRLPVDSMLQKISFQNNRLDTLSRMRPDSLYADAEGDSVKAFILGPGHDNPERFTVSLYYTKKLVGIPETFSKAVDNSPGRKLFRVSILGHGAYYPAAHMTMPGREYLYEMSEKTSSNPGEAAKYFNRYQHTR